MKLRCFSKLKIPNIKFLTTLFKKKRTCLVSHPVYTCKKDLVKIIIYEHASAAEDLLRWMHHWCEVSTMVEMEMYRRTILTYQVKIIKTIWFRCFCGDAKKGRFDTFLFIIRRLIVYGIFFQKKFYYTLQMSNLLFFFETIYLYTIGGCRL